MGTVLTAEVSGYTVRLDTDGAVEADLARHEAVRLGHRAGSWTWPATIMTPSGVRGACTWSVEDCDPQLSLADASIPGGLSDELLGALSRGIESAARAALETLGSSVPFDVDSYSVCEDLLRASAREAA